MRTYLSYYCQLVLLTSCAFLAVGRVTLYGRSPSQVLSASQHLEHKRQPSTPQEQWGISVPVPGEQSQNSTGTAGAGDGAPNEPGMITNSPATDDAVDCRNLTTGRDNKCWDELKLTMWVEDWVDTNKCHADEPFASCFLRKEGFPGLDCTGIKISACTAPQGDNLLKQPEVFYVAYNIYGKL